MCHADRQAAEDVKNNEKLGLYFDDLEAYIHRLLYQPGYVASRSAVRKASSLFDDAQDLLKENADWKRDAQELQSQLQQLVEGVQNDETTNNLVEAIEELGDSLATAGQIGLGSLKADGQGLYRDFMDVIVPRIIGLIKEIPVPRIEFKSEGECKVPTKCQFKWLTCRCRSRHRRLLVRVCFIHSRLGPIRCPQRSPIHSGLRYL
jgi:hypothetical protein